MPRKKTPTKSDRRDAEIAELRAQLAEARETIEAIRTGAVDGLVVSGETGEHVFTLASAETPYRSLVEAINEGALLLRADGSILYANRRFAEMTARPLNETVGEHWSRFFSPSDQSRLASLLSGAAAKGARAELMLNARDKGELPVQLSLSGLNGAKDQTWGAIVADLSERKQAELKLDQAHATLLEAQKIAHLGSFEYVAATRTTVWSEEEFRIYGLDPSGPSPEYDQMLRECIHPEDAALLHQTFTAALQRLSVYELEHRIVRPDGSVRWVFDRAHPYLNEQGELIRYVGTTLDITERKQAEERLRASVERYSLVVESAGEGVWSLDAEMRTTFVSARMAEMIGYTPAAMLGRHPLCFVPTEDQPAAARELGKSFAKPGYQPSELHLRRKDGSEIWVQVNSSQLKDKAGRVTGVVGLFTDVTERKRMEELLRACDEAKFRAIFDGASDGILLTDVQTRKFVLANASICRMLGYTVEELTTLGVDDIYPPAELSWIHQEFGRMIKGGEDVLLPDLSVRRKDGSVFHASLGTAVITLDQRLYVAGFFRDTTERKRAETNLRASEARYRTLVERLPIAVVLADTTGRIIAANTATAVIQKVQSSELVLGQTLADLIAPSERERVMRIFQQTMERGAVEPFESLVQCADGSSVPAELGGVVLRDDQGHPTGLLALAQDLSVRKAEQRALVESEARYRLLVENLPLGVIVMDSSCRIVMANQAVVELVKAGKASELVGRIAWDFILPGDQAQTKARAGELVRHGTVPPSERQMRRVDGSTVPVEARAVELKDADGKLIGLLGIAEDISHRKRAEAEAAMREAIWRIFLETDSLEQIYQRLAEELASRLGFAIAAVELYDARRQEMRFVGMAGMAEIPKDLRVPAFETLSGVVAQTQCPVSDSQAHLRMGDVHENLRKLGVKTFICVPFHDNGEVAGAVVLADRESRDDAESWMQNLKTVAQTLSLEVSRRRLEDELRQLNRDLEHRVAERTAELSAEVAQRREREFRLRKLTSAVEQSPASVVITDRAGTIEYVNPQFERITGYTAAEVVGRTPGLLKSGAHPPEFYAGLWSAISAGQPWRGEICNRHKDGSLFWELVMIAPVADSEGQTTHFVAIKEDITERRRVAEELRQAKEAADAANRAKSVFLAKMSHEIRTPMNAVLGFTQLMQRDPNASPKQLERLDTILRSGEHLLHIINEILEVARIESGRVTLNAEPFAVPAFLSDLNYMFAQRAKAQGVSFIVDPAPELPAMLIADQTKLRQIFINLLGNAFKFTPSGGQVELRIQSAPEPDGTVLLMAKVIDTGPGIPQTDKEQVFEPFFQTAAGQAAGGTGLGLTISRQLARRMGGDLKVSLPDAGGTCFEFHARFPVPRTTELAAEPVCQQVQRLAPNSAGYRVLVVDDAPENRELLTELLTPLLFNVRSASNGIEALALCQQWNPGLVLLDQRMPVMDGLETARRLRSEHGNAIRILILTANVGVEAKQRALSAGADGFIEKPFQHMALLEAIRQAAGVNYLTCHPENTPQGETPAVNTLPGEALRRLPEALLAKLRHALLIGDISVLVKLSADVNCLDEHLGSHLSNMAQRYDYAGLHALLKPETGTIQPESRS